MTPEEIQRYELLDELNTLFEVGDRRRVIARTTEILQSQPDDIGVLRWRAHAHATLGDEKACRDDYARVLSAADRKLQEDPQNWHRWMDRADAHDALGNRQAAYDDYSRVIELKSDVWMPFVRRAEIGLELGRFADSLKDADTAKELNWSEEDTMFDYLRSACYVGLGDLASARSCVKTIPDSDEPHIAEMHRAHVEGCAALEQRLALEAKALTPFEAATGRDQPRDDLGRWSEAGRSSAREARIAPRTGIAADAAPEGEGQDRAVQPRPDPRGDPAGVAWHFIDDEEEAKGGSEEEREERRRTGTVPADKVGKPLGESGVTIGSGFDLGSKTVAAMRRLDIQPPEAAEALIAKLEPYFGKKKEQAQAALRENPLKLSSAQVAAIDTAQRWATHDRVQAAYDRAVERLKDPTLRPFKELSREVRTVLLSVAHQYHDLEARTPRFWGHMIRQNWPAAIAELEDFHDAYGPRRRREALLLRGAAGARER